MNERICVNTRKAMKDEIDDKYKIIILTGEVVDDVKREVNNSKKGVINKLSNVSLIGGIFLWPLLIA
ncbi:hypothetical protein ACV3RB_14640 [Clostridium perfringens]